MLEHDPAIIWRFDSERATDALEARLDFLQTLAICTELDIDNHAAEIIFSELVANVVRHAPGAIQITLAIVGSTPTLQVSDTGMGFVYIPALPGDPYSEQGRGLYLVSQYADEVCVENFDGGGASVSATLPLRIPAEPARQRSA